MIHVHLPQGSPTPHDFLSPFPFSKGFWNYLPGSWSSEPCFYQDTIWLVRGGFGGKTRTTGKLGGSSKPSPFSIPFLHMALRMSLTIHRRLPLFFAYSPLVTVSEPLPLLPPLPAVPS